MCLCLVEDGLSLCLCGRSAPRHGRPTEYRLFLLLSAVSDGDVDCCSMTEAVWTLGWTVLNAPLQCLEGNTIWPHTAPLQSFEISAVCSTIYYHTAILAGGAASETTLRRGNNMLALCISASADHTGTGSHHSGLFFSFFHLFWLRLCFHFGILIKRLANDTLKEVAQLWYCAFLFVYRKLKPVD